VKFNFANLLVRNNYVSFFQGLPDLIPDPFELQQSAYLEDKQLYFLQCSMEENCLASTAYK